MLAVFGTQRRPSGNTQSYRKSIFSAAVTKADETYVYAKLDVLYASLSKTQKASVFERMLGNGASAIGVVQVGGHQVVSGADVVVYYAGDTSEGDGRSRAEAAHILSTYERHRSKDSSEVQPDNTWIARLTALPEGPFAFVIYDRTLGRITAARDCKGLQALHWGTDPSCNGLLFASCRDLLQDLCVDVDTFPVGIVFASHPFATRGTLTSLRSLTAAQGSSPAAATASEGARSGSTEGRTVPIAAAALNEALSATLGQAVLPLSATELAEASAKPPPIKAATLSNALAATSCIEPVSEPEAVAALPGAQLAEGAAKLSQALIASVGPAKPPAAAGLSKSLLPSTSIEEPPEHIFPPA